MMVISFDSALQLPGNPSLGSLAIAPRIDLTNRLGNPKNRDVDQC